MQKTKSNKKTKTSFWTKFHLYRTKIALLSFIVIIPITLILVAYLGPLQDSRSVTFDRTITSESEYFSDFKKLSDLDDLNLEISWLTYRKPVSDGQDNYVNGSFTFNIKYEPADNKNISNVRVQLVLKPLYGTTQDTNNPVTVNSGSSGSNFTVPHNVIYPYSPLWFINIKDPIVYIKIQYTESFTGNINPIEKTEYAYFSLNGIDPTNVE